MERIATPGGVTVSYDRYGEGPPLVLVHGGFSDHATNWQGVRRRLRERFTVCAVARRGRGETSATQGHSVDDESGDVAAVVRAAGQPVFLLGHSYGGVCALGAAALDPARVRKLVLYEPPHPSLMPPETVARLEHVAATEDLDTVVEMFMRDILQVPPAEVAAIRATPFWRVWTVDAEASLNDVRALSRHRFDAARYRALRMPVQLLVGTESPREIYLTDALLGVLPDARVTPLEGQAHEGMTTAPDLFVDAISAFLLD